MENHFTKQFDRFFALMRKEFPDYENYARMETSPKTIGDRFAFPGRETKEELLEEEKLKYDLAQQIKKLQEINELWKNESSWEENPVDFIHSIRKLHREAKRFHGSYSQRCKTIGDFSGRVFLQRCINDIAQTNLWLVTQMGKTIEQPDPDSHVDQDSLRGVIEASQVALSSRIKATVQNKEKQQLFGAICDKMVESSRKVTWNSSEYKVMLFHLQVLNESREENIQTKVVSLIEATKNYIKQKKDIPLTENGKTRLRLAHTLLDLAMVVQEGARVERGEKSLENPDEQIKRLQKKLLYALSPQLHLPNSADRVDRPEKIKLHKKQQPQAEKSYIGNISGERLLSLGDQVDFAQNMSKLAELQAKKKKTKLLISDPQMMHRYLKNLPSASADTEDLEKKYVELITSTSMLYDDYSNFCQEQIALLNGSKKKPLQKEKNTSSNNVAGEGKNSEGKQHSFK